MMITRLTIRINKVFGGSILNKASLEFAEEAEKNVRSNYKKSAVWIRAIVVDHPFTDGNKRTAFVILSSFIKILDQKKVADALGKIAKNNINDLNKIEEMIKNANRKKD